MTAGMAFSPADAATFLGRTRHLSCESFGCLTTIMAAVVVSGGRPVQLRVGTQHEHGDVRMVAGLIGIAPRRFKRTWPAIAEFFEVEDGCLHLATSLRPAADWLVLTLRNLQPIAVEHPQPGRR